MKRPCIDCGKPTYGPRCVNHHPTTRQARGDGLADDQARRSMVVALPLRCAYCGVLIQSAADLAAADVIDGDPTAGRWPSHRLCNQRARQ